MKLNLAKLTGNFARTLLPALLLVAIAAGVTQAQYNGGSDDRDNYSETSGEVYALTSENVLISFNSNNPTRIKRRLTVKNLRPNEQLLGIDFRPANGWLYALGSTNQIYVINRFSGVATQVGAQFTPALEGNEFGFDFNPAVDRIRIVSNTGQNLRVHPDLGSVVDADPAAAGLQVDGRLNYGSSPATGVTGAAYINPDNDPNTPTVLYNIDTDRDVLVRQDPPNAGTLVEIGSLGVNTSAIVGFDIGLSGSNTGSNNYSGLAALQTGNGSQLHSIDIASGKAQLRGQIGYNEVIRGLAIVLPQPKYNNDGTYRLGNTPGR